MRLARTLPRFMTLILVFALMITAAQTNALQRRHRGEKTRPAQRATDCTMITTYGKKVSVYLHGVMIGRNKTTGDKRFELGVVKRVPGHKFDFSVYVKGERVCRTEGRRCAKRLKEGKTWIFEVIKYDGKVSNDIEMWTAEAAPAARDKERLMTVDEARDSRYILNIEDLHGGKLPRYNKPFKPVFYFHSGKVKTKCFTNPIIARRIENQSAGPGESFERIAEVVEVEFELKQTGDRLVLREASDPTKVLWQHCYKPSGEAEGRVLNLNPDPESSAYYCRNRYDCDCDKRFSTHKMAQEEDPEDSDPTDFQNYYYLVFDVDRLERFELINTMTTCGKLKLIDKQGNIIKMAPPPHKCGMGLVRSGSDPIEF